VFFGSNPLSNNHKGRYFFYEWVMRNVLPLLPQATGIVRDNATFHKRSDLKEAILDAGHALAYLPSYSPDLNPIEQKWVQIKKMRLKLQCTTQYLFKMQLIYL
jgi:transposase